METIKLLIRADIGRVMVPYLRRHLRSAHALLDSSLSELSLALVNDRTMSRLHEQFLRISGPTDVLTFPLEADRNGRITSGEVVVCVPEARRQARLRRTRPEREVLLYALHGMLHLSGFDDRTAKDFEHMHRKEDEILERLGIGPVFAGPTRSRAASTGGK